MPFIILTFDNQILKILIDTGADKSYIDPCFIPHNKRNPTDLTIKSLFKITNLNQKTTIKFNELHKPIELYLLKFHKHYDGLIGYETLRILNANILLEQRVLQSSHFSIPLHDKPKSCIKPFFLEPMEKIIKEIPTNLPHGQFYTTPIQLREKVYVQEGLYSIHKPNFSYVEIINLNNEPKEIYLLQPINVTQFEEKYTEINFHITNKHVNHEKIESKIITNHLNPEEKQKITNLCKQFKNIFYNEDQKLTFSNKIKHEINLSKEKPVYVKQYRHPENQKQEIKNEIQKLLNNGIIRPSFSPWSSPIWMVPKKPDANGNKQWRLVVDYRQLNAQTIDDKYPLPNIDNILDKLGKSIYFSTIDLAAGFHQIEIASRDIPKTGFSIESGHYEFVRMPFGLKNAPSTFQRVMDHILGDLQGKRVLCYMDDIIVFSTSLQEHINDLKQVFTKLQDANLKIQLNKTHFLQKEIGFLGHLITSEGVKPNPQKIAAIQNFKIPSTQKEIKSFLGLIGYYRKFIKNFAKITKPLTSCLSKKATIILDQEYINCFEKCKSLLTNDPILRYPDFSQPFVLTTDASNYALGGILSQNYDGKDLPIAYASRTLSKTEVNYSTIEKECLAIVWACKYFRPYLYGRKFSIITDHKPLVWLFNAKDPTSKIVRWRLRLEEYDYTISYKKGTSNTNADALSRLELNSYLHTGKLNYPNTIDSIKTPVGKNYINSELAPQKETVNQSQENPEQKLKNTQAYRDELTMLFNINVYNENESARSHNKEQNENGIPESTTALNEFHHQLIIKVDNNYSQLNETCEVLYEKYQRNTIRKSIFTEIDIEIVLNSYTSPKYVTAIYTDDTTFSSIQKIFIKNPTRKIVRAQIIKVDVQSKEEQKSLITNTHLPYHRGIKENYEKIKRNFYFPNMKQLIAKHIRQCDICNMNKYERQPVNVKFKLSQTPQGPMEIIHADTFALRSKNFLTIIDKFSKFASVFELSDRKSQTMIQKFLQFFSREGIPKLLILDSATEFTSETIKQFVEMMKLNLHISTAKSSTGNSPIERLHSTLTELARIIYVQHPNKSITHVMDEALFAYNNSIHSATNLTPFELHRGHILTKNIPDNIPEQNEQYLEDIRNKYQEISSYIARLNESSKSKYIQAINQKRSDPKTFSVNDVIFEKSTTRDKLTPKYIKHTIQQDNDVTVKTNKRPVHKNRIRNINGLDTNNILATPQASTSTNTRTLRSNKK